MRVAVLHNPPVTGKPDSEDVVRQLEFVLDTLADGGYEPSAVPFVDGMEGVRSLAEQLSWLNPSVAFNLVEAVGDDPANHPAAAAFLDVMNIVYTGSPHDVLVTTTNKPVAKAILRASGITTPDWRVYELSAEIPHITLPCIVKPVREDASVGIHDSSVCTHDGMFAQRLREMSRQYGPLLIEEYIEGREFNISLLENDQGDPEVLPPAEIRFRNWPEGKPRIVNYSAKWDNRTFEFHNTVREFPSSDDPVLRVVADSARQCWKRFGLRGYARVDMRVDAAGRVCVIEINANPCISPDAGFIAAANHASLSPGEVLDRIMNAALSSSRHRMSR